jgi:hypothetical protein
MTSAEAYAAYLAAIESERVAMEAFLTADDAEPFDQGAFDDALQEWVAERKEVDTARKMFYAVRGVEHGGGPMVAIP